MYQVIPRKYRPKKFGTVVGQEAIVTTLKNALQGQKLAHAYLFCGPKGTGKTTLARLFAKAINCTEISLDQEPCNACPSCQAIDGGQSLDFLEIDGASNRGIDDIRQINETVGYAPAYGKYKIYLIDEVHMLTKEAFNALLKTLEEPPSKVKFFLATTEPHKVLSTIISRCQRFDFHRITPESALKKLSSIVLDLGVEIESTALQLLIKIAEGSLRDAESLLDKTLCYASTPITAEVVIEALGLPSPTLFQGLDEAIKNTALPFAFELTQHLFSAGKDLSYFLDALIEHFRDHLLQAAKKEGESLFNVEHCLYILDFLLTWSQKFHKTPFKKVCLEIILLHLIRSPHRLSLDSLVKRLALLEAPPSPSLEQKLLSAIKAKEDSPPPLPVKLEEKGEIPVTHGVMQKSDDDMYSPIKNETLLRFAAVELEGTIRR